MALFFVFGTPGSGKSYVGRILETDYGYYCYDADDDLTADMIAAIQNEQVFTEAMRQAYFNIVTTKTLALVKKHANLVVTQALIKEKNRQQVLAQLPKAQFIHVTADVNTINKRLKIRNNWVSIDYANKIRAIFEEPQLSHFTIDNNLDKQHVKNQLDTFLDFS